MNEERKKFMVEMRKRSGAIKSKDRLVSFLYILMRDHIPSGQLETIYLDHVINQKADSIFTNGWLANYAKDFAERLK